MPRTNLTAPVTSFVGRKHELAQVRQLLETTRLLTPIGAGGCGKTRLALQTAIEFASEFSDGVFWCDLTSLSDPAPVADKKAASIIPNALRVSLANTAPCSHPPSFGEFSA